MKIGRCAFGASLLAVICCAGCAGVRGGADGTDGAAGRGGRGGGGGAGAGGAGGSAGGGTAPADARVADGGIGGPGLGDAACATESQQAKRTPLDLYLMIDSSGSMASATPNGQTKWAAVTAALRSFINDPQSAGLGVGLQYFPLIHAGVPASCYQTSECGSYGPCQALRVCATAPQLAGCDTAADCPAGDTCVPLGACLLSGAACRAVGQPCPGPTSDVCLNAPGFCVARDFCDAASYARPAVEVAPLPGAAAALLASIGGRTPDGLTPTAGALGGVVSHAQALARANPDHRVVAVIATDGLPSECAPGDIAGLGALVGAGLTGPPSVSTYVIGVFSADEQTRAQANLDALARAGGTSAAFVINTTQDVAQAFLTALNAVRTQQSLACAYQVPTPTGGDALDFERVNVTFTSSSGQTFTVGNVPDKASCHPTQGGWYYDVDPASGARPQTITVCDNTCSALRADSAGRVDILLGCKTQGVVP